MENRKTGKNVSCHCLRDEVVNGESAQVYSAHPDNEDEQSDLTSGFPKRAACRFARNKMVDVGGAGDKTHYCVRYDYRNVSTPPVS